jgi:long-chain acyl-CoA synthetase
MNQFLDLMDILRVVEKKYKNPKAVNFYQDGKWKSFSSIEFIYNIRYLTLGLEYLGVSYKTGFAIIAKPSPAWLMMDFSILVNRAISVPIFPDISEDHLSFEINNSGIEFVFCDSADNLQIIQNSGIKFSKIITYGFFCEAENIMSFESLLEKGKAIYQTKPVFFDFLANQIEEYDLATIVYTSGSTGVPKGVEITHKNLASQINNISKCFKFNESDSALSFLPLAHIFERMVVLVYIANNTSIYFVDDVKNIGKFLIEIKPTLITVVPRILEKVFIKIKNGVDESNFFKKWIGNKAFEFALNYSNHKSPQHFYKLKNTILNFLVYKKFRASLGGNLKMIICGGAPLSLNIENFFWGIGFNLYVGYGTTESSPVIAVNFENSYKIGAVGKALPGVVVKIDENGELLAKGDNVMKGYHKNLEETNKTIVDSWLKTGDLATIDDEGFIKIIGRKKELFKTAGGKYVSPVPIEQSLLSHFLLLAECCVVAEGRKFVSCLLFIDFEILAKYKKKVNLDNLSDQEFLKSDFLKNRLDRLVANTNKSLDHWEQIQKYYLSDQPLSIKTGELTPSMKLRRHFVEKKYQDVISNFYLADNL